MVFDVLRAIGRRWYAVVVGLLLTAGLAFGAYQASPPEYNARALVLLLPSKAEVGTRGNPYLSLSGLEQPAGILAALFSSEPVREDVEKLSPTAQFVVGIDEDSRGPVLAVDVTDQSAEATMRTLNYLLERIPSELTRLQDQVNARGNVAVSSMQLTVDRQADLDIKGTVRLVIAALIIGIVATGASAYGIDSLIQRRRMRSAVVVEKPASSLNPEKANEVPPAPRWAEPTT